ncbi:MAG: hypothetical protein U5K72_14690 [Balneolaceae bacterium]|nr:hypothetical protein [Balneolaceae bacterium]
MPEETGFFVCQVAKHVPAWSGQTALRSSQADDRGFYVQNEEIENPYYGKMM